MLRRFFAQVGSLREIGPIPANLNKYFELLAGTDIYAAKNNEKLVRVLHNLTVDYKKQFDPFNITELLSQPALKKMLSRVPETIKEVSSENAIKLMRSFSTLGVRDPRVWLALEKRFSLVLHDAVDETAISYAIDCFTRAKVDTPRLWNSFESVLLRKICPKHSLSSKSVAVIINAFALVDKGSQQLMEAMEQQVIRVAPNLNGSELVKILLVYTRLKTGSDNFYKELNRQAKYVCSQMTNYELTMCLSAFLKSGKSTTDLLDRLEETVIIAFDQLTLRNITTIVDSYAVHLLPHTTIDGPRRTFINTLLNNFFSSYDRLVPKGNSQIDKYLVSFMWGISLLKANQNLKLLKRLLEDLRRRNIKENAEFVKQGLVISAFFKECYIS